MKNKKLNIVLCFCLLFASLSATYLLTQDKPVPTFKKPPSVDATNEPRPSSSVKTAESGPSNAPNTQSPTGSSIKRSASDSTIVKTTKPDTFISYAKQHQLYIERTINYGNLTAFLVGLPSNSPSLASLTTKLPEVELTPNYRYTTALTPTDPSYSSQWNLSKVQMAEAWDYSTGSSNVTLAVIDSGILFSQNVSGVTYQVPDLPTNRIKYNAAEQGTTQPGGVCWTGTAQDKSTNNCDDDANGYVDDYKGWDFIGGFRGNSACPNFNDPNTYESLNHTYVLQDNEPQPYSCDNPSLPTVLNKDDYNGNCNVSACTISHGTMVASVAGAEMNSTSIVGVNPNVKLMNLRVFDGYGYTDSARIAEAILYAKNNGAHVINLSLVFTTCDGVFTDSTVESAMAAAKNAGLIIVAASGNYGTGNVCYPASSAQAIAVGATNSSDNKSSFSNYGSQLDMTAPGESVLAAFAPSAANSNATSGLVSGTSFAAPHVAALAAMVKGIQPNATSNQVKDILMLRSDLVSGMNSLPFVNTYGYGRMNALTSVRVAKSQLPVYKLVETSLPDVTLTNSITERNNIMTSSKLVYQGIDFWDLGNNYSGNLSDYRNNMARTINQLP